MGLTTLKGDKKEDGPIKIKKTIHTRLIHVVVEASANSFVT